MFNARLPWQRHHGGHVIDMMGCDHPSFVQIGPLIFQYGSRLQSWIWILSLWTTHEVNYAVWLPCQNLVSIRSLHSQIIIAILWYCKLEQMPIPMPTPNTRCDMLTYQPHLHCAKATQHERDRTYYNRTNYTWLDISRRFSGLHQRATWLEPK